MTVKIDPRLVRSRNETCDAVDRAMATGEFETRRDALAYVHRRARQRGAPTGFVGMDIESFIKAYYNWIYRSKDYEKFGHWEIRP